MTWYPYRRPACSGPSTALSTRSPAMAGLGDTGCRIPLEPQRHGTAGTEPLRAAGPERHIGMAGGDRRMDAAVLSWCFGRAAV